MKTSILIAVLLFAGCTDAQFGQFAAIGKSAHVVCYSGTMKIYEGDSEGIVKNETQSDGWYFTDKQTGRLVEISAPCVFTY